MDIKDDCKTPSAGNNDTEEEFQELLQQLETKNNWDGRPLIKYGDLWHPVKAFRPLLSSQKNFRANDTDIIVASMPKSGTTWLKALTFSIAKRNTFSMDQNPLLTENPHTLVSSLEHAVYWEEDNPDLQNIPSPRLFSSHRSYTLLADLVHGSECKVIYICRNPLDQFISYRFFSLENNLGKDPNPLSIDEAFDEYCNGILPFGPIWDQILSYWYAHLKNPEKVLFLRYEDMKEDIVSHVKVIAEFIGQPFSAEEEKQGLVEEIARICSFENLSNLEINKTGVIRLKFSSFFRKGAVGDWTNHLSPEMAQRLTHLMESKFQGSGLVFKV